MSYQERGQETERRPNEPRMITHLREFLKEPQPGEVPLGYIATRRDTPYEEYDREQGEPKLYPIEDLTPEKFMEAVYPDREYQSYEDIVKAETYTMPGFDLYVVPIQLDKEARGFSFHEQVAEAFSSHVCRPDWSEALGEEDTENLDPDEDMRRGVMESFQALLPVFANTGPLDLPHYHISTAIGLDSYAEEWLGVSSYQLDDKPELREMPIAERFNEEYGKYGVKFGRLLTLRYRSFTA